MNNDNFFVWPRFRAYFMKLMREHWKTNVVRIILVFAALFIVTMLVSVNTYDYYMMKEPAADFLPLKNDPMHSSESFIFLCFLFVLGCYWASQMMCDLKGKTGRVFVLTTPVTPFEGWLSRWLLHVPCFPVVFLAAIYVTDLIRVAVFSPLVKSAPVEIFTWPLDPEFFSMMLVYALASSLYVLGSAFFPKRPLLMTSIVLFFVGWIYGFAMFFLYAGLSFCNVDNSVNIPFVVEQCYMAAVVLFCWWLSYRRYKEFEIIDRM